MRNDVSALDLPVVAPDEQLRRKDRLLAIVENGLPPFQHTVMDLMAILNDPSADTRKAAKPIGADPVLSAQILRMCNSPLFSRRSRVISIEQAVAMLGADRLRSLAMTSSLAGFAGQGLPKDQVASFWQHSFLAAMLSKHLAEFNGYAEKEQAYIAGLLHDIGQVPEWMLAAEEKARHCPEILETWVDNPTVERAYFGTDHCEIGSRMAESWGLMPSFVEVILAHHTPEQAEHDPYLVEIVAAVEHFLLAKEELVTAPGEAEPSAGESQPPEIPAVTQRSRQPFADEETWKSISENLYNEYVRVLPLVEGSLTSMLGAAS
jgi:putative nucleotidyltransferase with HDIG domain